MYSQRYEQDHILIIALLGAPVKDLLFWVTLNCIIVGTYCIIWLLFPLLVKMKLSCKLIIFEKLLRAKFYKFAMVSHCCTTSVLRWF